ncbi:MAG TPA: DUF1800 domain-containing protein [Alphaproteobacteria bacterium]|nr:DUF1800 domain-containing protein [Alphaproteobacteria bacterium]
MAKLNATIVERTVPSQTVRDLALGRLAFGPSTVDRARFAEMGFQGWLDDQLAPNGADPVADARIRKATLHVKYGSNPANDYPPVDEMRPLRTIDQPIEATWKLLDPDPKVVPPPEKGWPRMEVSAATLIRAVYSRWQLREVLVDFWHNHFNVNAVGDQAVNAALPTYDRDVIRKHALGNFRVFLEAVATSAAMQIYLDNRSSRAGNANENYGRELFELHTLGRDNYFNAIYDKWRKVPGALQGKPIGYIDQDVYEAARAFTGWTIEDGSGVGPGQSLPKTGKFTYVESWHDNYQKRVLGTEFDPFQAPMADGRKVLDLVARHPATARYICFKLCRRLVSDNPPESLVLAAADIWKANQKSPDQIARTVRFIASSAAFENSRGAKVKRPLETAASFIRATGIDFSPTEGLINELGAGGQRLFGWGPPTGHPDTRDYWISTNAMRHRWALILGIADNYWQTGIFDPTAAMGESLPPALAVAHFWRERLLPDAGPETAERVLAAMNIAPSRRPDGPKDPKAPFRHIVAALAMAPAFQVR